MAIEINIDPASNDGEKLKEPTVPKGNSQFLADIPLHEIAKVFARFNSENIVTVIPIGFPQAGKSMLLSSLFRYCIKGKDTTFGTNLQNNFPFDNGRKAADSMIQFFESGRLYNTTMRGSLDLVGVNINPSNLKLPTLKLAFLDLAGEDIQNIKTTEKGDFTAKINAVFNGLQVDDAPVIFAIVTPFDPPKARNRSEILSSDESHRQEDALHFDFINYLKQDQPNLFKNSKFFIIVSQWDKNKNDTLKVEDYIKSKRPSIYNSVKDSDVVWGEYSIGKLLETTDEEGRVFQSIVTVDSANPKRFWNKLYEICTGKSLDHKSFWEKLFS